MSGPEVVYWIADVLIPVPYVLIGALLFTRDRVTWRGWVLIAAMFFVGGVLEGLACLREAA
jgi:surface polysaccharide O-acyltransferase-like enzyme